MIPQETIDRIKKDVDLIGYIRARGVDLQKNGKEYKGCCPFHDDSNPSFSVNPVMKLWYCFGCDEGGDVIKFVQKMDNIPFDEAVSRLAPDMAASSSLPRSVLLARVFDFYRNSFAENPYGRDYLAARGIKNAELFKTVRLGYSDGSLIKTLSSDLKTQLKDMGVLTKSGRELFTGCVVFPLVDSNGQIVSLYGRHVKKDQHLYLPGPLRGLFVPPRATDHLILTEGVIDALTLLNHGFKNALAIYGVNGLTDDHLTFFKQQRIKRVTLCLDADETGRNAMPAITAKLEKLGVAVTALNLPDGQDVNDFFTSQTKADFDALLNRSECSKEKSGSEMAAPAETAIDGGSIYAFASRSYRVLGMNRNGLDRLKVNLKVSENGAFHIDTLDLYAHRAREHFVKTSARLLEAAEEEITGEVNTLISLLEKKRLEGAEPEKDQKEEMTEAERKEALKLLKSKNLLKQLLKDFETCGTIGEETAKLFGYLATISRFLAKPLGVLIVSRSGAGKSRLQEAVTDFVPPEDLQRYTRITGQSLFYKQGDELKHKVLSIAEEKGAEDAIYSIRTLQSDQFLTVAVTITDPKNGQKKTEEYRIEGPVVILITTTNPEALDFETRNRFVILTIDESREQTRKILKMQRETDSLEGLIRSKNKDHIFKKHHNAQRLLKRIHVVNPYHDQLQYPDAQLLMRRDHQRYLTLIKTIAFLHQYQREIKTVKTDSGERLEYVEVTPEDIKLANQLAADMLGRSLDELSPHTRSLLSQIKEMVDDMAQQQKKDGGVILFTRRDICDRTGWSYWQVHDHLKQLVDMEYLLLHTGNAKNRYAYELAWDGSGQGGGKFFAGLTNVNQSA